MKKWYEKLVELVLQAEETFVSEKSGDEKKKFVVDTLNNFVDIPLIPEFIEAKLIDSAIDLAVYIFNTYVWKKIKSK